jgi:hypothetical protein
LIATLSGDQRKIAPFLLRATSPDILWAGAYPTDVAALLAAQYRHMPIMRVPAPDSEVFLASDALPVPLRLVRDSEGWRVEAEGLLRIRHAVISDAV